MGEMSIWAFLFLAFGLGMLHALDADHIMAVTSMATKKPNRRTSILFCMRWAFGHGSALLIIGFAVFFLGVALPIELSEIAENLVGVILVLLGCWLLWDLSRRHIHIHFHHHDGLPEHAHLHEHQSTHNHQHKHTPVLVGVLHGVAGSAPLLALLPMSKVGTAWVGLSYLVLFSLGVFLSMMFFGGLLGELFFALQKIGNRLITSLRASVAMLSIGFGSYLISQASL